MSFDTPNPTYSASDPYSTFLNASCFEHLLIELVPLAERMARRLEDSIDGRGGPVGGAVVPATGGSTTGTGASTEKERDGEVFRDAVYFRLESLGYRVGLGLSER
jgi:trafficking protein particle complex subunit 6